MKIISIGLALLLLLAGVAYRTRQREPASPPPAEASLACAVQRVTDGDSIWCEGRIEVRLLGIDAPEMNQGSLGRRSREALVRLLPPGTPVRLETDVRERDQYQRLLAYLWRGDTLVNARLVREGWAMLYTVPPNVRYVERIQAAQDSARALGAGLWAEGGFDCIPSQHRQGRC